MKGLAFLNKYGKGLKFIHLLYLLPYIYYFFKVRKNKDIFFAFKYNKTFQPTLIFLVFVGFFILCGSTISSYVPEDKQDIIYSEKDLYDNLYSSDSVIFKFGVLTYSTRDVVHLFSESDQTIEEKYETIENYLSTIDKNSTNDYTGYFEGKNLILIMAESLDTYAINKELTPNLYKLKTEGWYFDNYYAPFYFRSTGDTEFITQTSFYPSKNVKLSMDNFKENNFLYTYPKLFEEKDYITSSYHNYTDYFYPRSDFHTITLGYDEYFGASRLGMLDEPTGLLFSHDWQSDLDLFEKSLPHFINEDKFMTYLLTVSGHLDYDETHPIGQKNYDLVKDLDVDESIKYYLATQIELDKGIEYLLSELEKANKLDDTVIVIMGDHYAYGVDKDIMWEYDEIKKDKDDLDLHKVPFIIYNSDTESKTIPNYMSSIDVLPTIANLFNLNIDHNKVMGYDIFTYDEHYVRFATLSFVSDDFRYDFVTDTYEIYDNRYSITDLEILKNKLLTQYIANELILETDYYREKE